MLFTRCPDCDTTFRVTDDVLKKANGQVRCGRCASVFNALSELRGTAEGDAAPPAAEPSARAARTTTSPPDDTQRPSETAALKDPAKQRTAQTSTASKAEAEPSDPKRERLLARGPTVPTKAAPDEDQAAKSRPIENADSPLPMAGDPGANEQLGALVADVIAQIERGGAAPEDADTSELEVDGAALQQRAAITAAEVEAVLNADPEADASSNEVLAASILAWPGAARSKRGSHVWSVAALCAALVLGAQGLHYFRADLVKNSWFGPIIRNAYGLFGVAITPNWDVHQYEILDWVASAEPNASGHGTLKITARIRNRGPLAQPYPLVQLRLKDRWETAVGSRIFKPAEYLDGAASPNVLMAPGTTARAQLEVVDPGPDAYGFDLDVCVAVETDVLSCGSDKVFL